MTAPARPARRTGASLAVRQGRGRRSARRECGSDHGQGAPERERAVPGTRPGGRYLSTRFSVVRALEVLEDTLTRSERTLGADHPDTAYVRKVLVDDDPMTADVRREPGELG
ncbi:hypothetical protein GCM10009802_66950 [Streptomyces synnematoformans]|uniref:Tetratricopeptide repeat protein n=1 Tax=Streptomyces synnematoformans TaxID=415721 RepID=A0ABN2AD31_9ACTN